MRQQEQLGTAPIGKLLLKYSIPAIIGMLVNALYNVVDRMFIGHIPGIGNLAITGVGITMPIITIILGFSMLVGIGATALISIKLGQGKKDEAEIVLANGVSLAVIIGILLTAVGIVFAKELLGIFGGTKDTIPYGELYIDIFLIGTVVNVLGFVFTSIMRADGSPKMSAFCMAAGCALNIVLDAAFIFGLNMGIQGAALATIISQAFTAGIGIFYFVKGKSNLKIRRQSLKIQTHIMREILVIGLAPCAMQIAISLVQIVMNNVLKQTGGSDAIGALTAISAITMMIMMPIFGINQGSQPIIGYNYGAKQYERAKKTSLLSILAGTVIFIFGFILLETMPELFMSMFDGEGALKDVAVPGLRLYILLMPVWAVPIIGANYFQAIGKAKKATFLSLLRQVIVLIPVILISSKLWGLTGAWLAVPISDAICTVIISIFLIQEFKSYKKLPIKSNR